MGLGTLRKGTASVGTSPRAPTLPASMAAGDVMYLFFSTEATSTVTTPAGWDAGPTLQAGTLRAAMFARAWQSGDAAPSVAFTGGAAGRAIIVAVPGAHTTTGELFNGSATASGTDATAETASAGNASTTGSMLVQFVASITAGTLHTPYFNMVEFDEGNSGGTTTAHHINSIDVEMGMAAGASPTNSRATTVAAAQWAACTFWVKPAVADTFGVKQSAFAVTGGATSLTATLPNPASNGNTLVAGLSLYTSSGTISLTQIDFDSAGRVFAVDRNEPAATDRSIIASYYSGSMPVAAPAVRALPSASTGMHLWVAEVVGIASSSNVDTSNGATASSVNVAVAVTPSTGPRFLVHHSVNSSSGTTHTSDADYVQRRSEPSASSESIFVQTREMTGAGVSETANMTLGVSGAWASTLVVYNPASSGTPKADSDTATMTDAGTLAAALTGTDTTTQTEAASLAAGLSGSDTSSLTAETASIGLSSSDSSTQTEAASLSAGLSSSDTATMTETASVSVALTGNDTQTQTENATMTAALSSSDSGTLSEQTSLDAGATPIVSSDTFTVTETGVLSASGSSSDTQTQTEAASLATALSGTDTSTQTEAASIATAGNSSDSGTLSEAASIAAALTSSDSFTMTESASVSVAVTASDTSTMSEAVSLDAGGTAKLGNDTQTQTEAASMTAALSSSDVQTQTEQAALAAAAAASDTFTLIEAALIEILASDTFTLTESAQVGASLNAIDSGVLVEAAAVVAALADSDSGVLAESAVASLPPTYFAPMVIHRATVEIGSGSAGSARLNTVQGATISILRSWLTVLAGRSAGPAGVAQPPQH